MSTGRSSFLFFFFFQAEDGIRDKLVTGVQTCALPISPRPRGGARVSRAVPRSGHLGGGRGRLRCPELDGGTAPRAGDDGRAQAERARGGGAARGGRRERLPDPAGRSHPTAGAARAQRAGTDTDQLVGDDGRGGGQRGLREVAPGAGEVRGRALRDEAAGCVTRAVRRAAEGLARTAGPAPEGGGVRRRGGVSRFLQPGPALDVPRYRGGVRGAQRGAREAGAGGIRGRLPAIEQIGRAHV